MDTSKLYDLLVKIIFFLHSVIPPDALEGHRSRFQVGERERERDRAREREEGGREIERGRIIPMCCVSRNSAMFFFVAF